MKKRYLSILIALFGLILIFNPNKAHATHAAGGELIYEWVSDSTYRFYFKFYRDCTGIQEGDSIDMCIYSANTSFNDVVWLKKLSSLPGGKPNGDTVATGCPGYPSRCFLPSSILPGYREWWYSALYTLPSKASDWKFNVNIGTRNQSENLVYGGSLYVEATLNNLIAQGNSSPYFSVKPIPYVCLNQPYIFNNGGVDPNKDSLAFEVRQPSTGNGCGLAPSLVAFATGTPTYSLPANPFQTNYTFTLAALTGQMSFTPTLLGSHTITIVAKEYRNGILIGSVMRDIQIQALACSTVQPTLTVDPTTVSGSTLSGGTITGCARTPMAFCFDVKSTDPTTVLVLSDNHNAATPGATITYTNLTHDSARGCFTWIPGPLDTGLKILNIIAKDSSCKPPGVLVSQAFTIPIVINPITEALKDTGICLGQSYQLVAVGGSTFTWTALPGGSGISSLSCTNCKSPFATPTVTTSYIVQSNLTGGCGKNRDTVTITVTTSPPSRPTASSNSPVCLNGTLNLTASGSSSVNYLWTGPFGYLSTQQNPTRTNLQYIDTGYYYVRALINGCASALDSTKVSIYPPKLPVFNNGPLCVGSQLQLTATTIPGATYSWTGPNSFTSTLQNPVINNIQTINAGVYTCSITFPGCSMQPGTTTLVVGTQTPVIDSAVITNAVTCGTGSIKLYGLLPNRTYVIDYTINGVPQTTLTLLSNGLGQITIGGLNLGTYVLTVKLNGCSSSVVGPLSVSGPPPPAAPTVTSPVGYCQFSPASPLTAVGSNLKWYTTATGGTGSSTAPTPSTVNAGSTTYYVSQTINGCESPRSPITVNIGTKPAPPVATHAYFYCKDQVTTPLNAVGVNLKWYNVPTGGTGSIVAPTPTSIAVGVYKWYVSQTINGCESDRDSAIVTIKAAPAPPTAANVNYCEGATAVPLTATGNNLLWYVSFVGGPGSPNAPTPNTSIIGVTPWYVSQSDSSCESQRTLIRVTVDEHVRSHIYINEDTICQYANVDIFNDSTNPKGSVYTWAPGDGGSILTGSGDGPYRAGWTTPGYKKIFVTITNGACSIQDSTDIYIRFAPVGYFDIKDNVCIDEQVILAPTNTPDVTYKWTIDENSIPEGNFQPQYTLAWHTTGAKIITLVVTAPNGCKSYPYVDTVYVHDPQAQIKGLEDGAYCVGDTVTVYTNAGKNYTYSWSPERAFITNGSDKALLSTGATGFIFLKVTDPWACVDGDTAYIKAEPCCDIFLPDVFSPNGDGRNDKFHILTDGHQQIVSFKVVNRWGQTIFKTDNQSDGWDGTFHGKMQDAGTYMYYVKYKCSNSTTFEKKGNVTLVR